MIDSKVPTVVPGKDIKDINPIKVNLFLRNLSIAKKKIDERKTAKKKLEVQFTKVKKIPIPKAKKPIMDKELKELEKKINEVIGAEKKIFTQQREEYMFSKLLEERINALEGKINEFLAYRTERKKKIQELENKVESKVKTRTEKISIIGKQLAKLENIHNNLKKSGKYDKETLNKIEDKIKALKQKL